MASMKLEKEAKEAIKPTKEESKQSMADFQQLQMDMINRYLKDNKADSAS